MGRGMRHESQSLLRFDLRLASRFLYLYSVVWGFGNCNGERLRVRDQPQSLGWPVVSC